MGQTSVSQDDNATASGAFSVISKSTRAPAIGRNTQGVRLFNMEKNELVVGVAAFEVDEDDLPVLEESGDLIEDGVESVSADLADSADGDDAGDSVETSGDDE